MARPSIFSSDYHRRMKRRKLMITICCFSLLCLAVIIFAGYRYNAFSKFGVLIKGTDKKVDKDNTNKGNDKQKEPDKQNPNAGQPSNSAQGEEKGYSFVLSNQTEIKLVYSEKDNDKSFKYVSPMDAGITSAISTDGKHIVVLDKGNQSLTCFDVDGNKTDISKNEYVAESGDVFTKDDRLKKTPDYIWHSSPKFIDGENVAYISQLPWFNKELVKYVWIVNIKTNYHRYVGELSGENLVFGDSVDKGLEVKIAEKTYYLSANGQITQ